MMITYFPFDAGSGSDVTEAEWGEMAQFWIKTGVIESGDAAKDLNKLEVYANSSGMQVFAKSGVAWIEGFFIKSEAVETLAIGTADPTYDRIDLVVVRLDRSANTISLEVVEGTPAASPVAPTVTETSTIWEIALAEVLVGNGVTQIDAGDVTDSRTLVNPYSLSIAEIEAALSIPPGDTDYICIVDQKTQNTDGGTFTSESWQTRDLNTELADTGNHASVASNQITLAAGTYRVYISAPAFGVHKHMAKLVNVTDTADILTGTSEYTEAASYVTRSIIIGRFTIADTKVLEVQHKCSTTVASIGLGFASNLDVETYTIVQLEREAD